MKKKIIILAASLFLIATGVSASSLNGEYNGNPIVKIKSNGAVIDPGEVPAMIYDGKTLVPISALRNLGATVTWDANTYSVDVKLPQSNSVDNLKLLATKLNAKTANLYKLVENSAVDLDNYTTYLSNYLSSNNQRLSNASTEESLNKSLQLFINTYNVSSDQYNALIKEYPSVDFSDLHKLLSINYNAIDDAKSATTYLITWNYYSRSNDSVNAQTSINNYFDKATLLSNAVIDNKYNARTGYNTFISKIIQ